MKILSTLAVLFLFVANIIAQDMPEDEIGKNAVFLRYRYVGWNLGGSELRSGVMINYEREMIYSSAMSSHSLWLGGGRSLPLSGDEYLKTTQFLAGINSKFGRRSFMEVQLGYVVMYNNDYFKYRQYTPFANLAFRYQKPNKGILFKISSGTFGLVNLELGYSF